MADDRPTLTPDPNDLIASLRVQRNDAQDLAAAWEALAQRLSRDVESLRKTIADLTAPKEEADEVRQP